MSFAEKLKELRERSGLTQAALAKASGVPIDTVREYEQGTRRTNPSLRLAAKLADALGVDCRAFADCLDDRPGEAASEARRPRGRPVQVKGPRKRKGK